MGLFTRKTNVELPISGFKKYLLTSEHPMFADYITATGDFDEDAFAKDKTAGIMTLDNWNVLTFKEKLVELYRDYLEVEPPAVNRHDEDLLDLFRVMPLNITIKRVKPKNSGNRWSAQYHKGTPKYGKDLYSALNTLFTKDKKAAKKLEQARNDKVAQ